MNGLFGFLLRCDGEFGFDVFVALVCCLKQVKLACDVPAL